MNDFSRKFNGIFNFLIFFNQNCSWDWHEVQWKEDEISKLLLLTSFRRVIEYFRSDTRHSSRQLLSLGPLKAFASVKFRRICTATLSVEHRMSIINILLKCQMLIRNYSACDAGISIESNTVTRISWNMYKMWSMPDASALAITLLFAFHIHTKIITVNIPSSMHQME